MNKTIIINISGVIFHIEEDAYERLKVYMNEVKAHFASYKDNFEIIGDIENRIAEMFNELLLAENKQVIVLLDVELMISKMGNTSDFAEEENDETFVKNENKPTYPIKKLYRDIDNRWIGGVCSGLAHYFDVDAKWIRFAFFIISVFFGVGFLCYIIFWMVMPKASTRTQKMEMKGEKINLQAFKKNMEEELDALKSNFQQASEIAKPGLARLTSFIQEFTAFIAKFIGTTGKIILKIFSFLIIFSNSLLLIAGFIFLLVFLGYAGNTDINTIFPLNAIRTSLRPTLFICAYLVAFIPVLGIILFLLKVVFKSSFIARSTGFTLLKIWAVALAIGIFCVAKNATDFKEKASFKESIGLKTNSKNTYYLVGGEERTIQENISNNGSSNRIITITGDDRDFDTPNNVEIELKVAENEFPYMVKTFSARGKNFNQALSNAHQIDYYCLQKDSLLMFDTQSALKAGTMWRNQTVKIRLDMPINSILYIQHKLANQFFREQLDECMDDESDDTDLIMVKVTKNGFTCEKSKDAIKSQENFNKENNIELKVEKEIIF